MYFEEKKEKERKSNVIIMISVDEKEAVFLINMKSEEKLIWNFRWD